MHLHKTAKDIDKLVPAQRTITLSDTINADIRNSACNWSSDFCICFVHTQSLKKSLHNSKLSSFHLILICKLQQTWETYKTLRDILNDEENT